MFRIPLGVLTAQSIGMGNTKLTGQYTQAGMILFLVSVIPITVVWMFVMGPVLRWFGFDEETVQLGVEFTQSYVWAEGTCARQASSTLSLCFIWLSFSWKLSGGDFVLDSLFAATCRFFIYIKSSWVSMAVYKPCWTFRDTKFTAPFLPAYEKCQ